MTTVKRVGLYTAAVGLAATLLSIAIYYNIQTSPGKCGKAVWVNMLLWPGLGLFAFGLYLYTTKVECFRMMVTKDGERDRRYRPYINQEETDRYLTPYNPYKPFHTGLYDDTYGVRPISTYFK